MTVTKREARGGLNTDGAFSRTLNRALDLLPRDGDTQVFLDNLRRERFPRPLSVYRLPLPPGTLSGIFLPDHDRDIIIVAKDAAPSRARTILMHEVGHLLLNHKPRAHAANAALKALASIHASSWDPELIEGYLMVLPRDGYADRQEHEAELFARHMAAEVERRAVFRDPIVNRLS